MPDLTPCYVCSIALNCYVTHTGQPCPAGEPAFLTISAAAASKNAAAAAPCRHLRIHTEGSLGWFCDRCGAPVEDTEEYADG
jgi:hypothetical protein